MNSSPLYIIRLSCNNMETAANWYKDQGFDVICAENEIPSVWLRKDSFLLNLAESAADSPALVGYWEKPDDAIRNLEELGVVFNFSADASGDHFEAHFTDPAGMPLIIADKYDLPEMIKTSEFKGELTIPSTDVFQDSVNFWHGLGFEIQPGSAQPHAWSVLQHSNLTVGIHQSMNWEKPGMCFDGKSCPFYTDPEAEFDIKVHGKLQISRTVDGCRIYRLGE